MNISGSVRWRSLAAAATLLLATAGCASEGKSPDESPSPSVSVSGTPTSEAPDDEALVGDTVDRFWAVDIRSQNQGLTASDLFAGVATGPFVELRLKTLRDYKASGVRRVGRPTLGEATVEVQGDKAVALMCVDEDPWGFQQRDKAAQYSSFGPKAAKFSLERLDGQWLVVDRGEATATELSC